MVYSTYINCDFPVANLCVNPINSFPDGLQHVNPHGDGNAKQKQHKHGNGNPHRYRTQNPGMPQLSVLK